VNPLDMPLQLCNVTVQGLRSHISPALASAHGTKQTEHRGAKPQKDERERGQERESSAWCLPLTAVNTVQTLYCITVSLYCLGDEASER